MKFHSLLPADHRRTLGLRGACMVLAVAAITFVACIALFVKLEERYRFVADRAVQNFKVEQLSRVSEPYDFVFVGTSIFYYSIDVNNILHATRGKCSMNLFNASYLALDFLEAREMLAAMKSNAIAKPHYVVIDPEIVQLGMRNIRSERKSWIYRGWDNWYYGLLAQGLTKGDVSSKWAYHYDYVQNTMRLGEMAQWLLDGGMDETMRQELEEQEAQSGYKPYVNDGQDKPRLRDMYDTKICDGCKQFGPEDQEMLDILIQDVLDMGSVPIILYNPVNTDMAVDLPRNYMPYLDEKYAWMQKLDMRLDDGARLLDTDYWESKVHMSPEGARHYAAMLGRELCHIVKGRE